jgi:hypothetical protein
MQDCLLEYSQSSRCLPSKENDALVDMGIRAMKMNHSKVDMCS